MSKAMDELNMVSNLKEEDMQKIQKEAEAMVVRLSSKKEEEAELLLDKLGRLGEVTQQKAGDSLEILKRPVKDMISDKHGEIPNTLLQLRSRVDELNPNHFFKKGGVGNLFRKLFGSNPLTNYIRKYESIQTQIENIVASLRNGRDMIQEDTIQLRQIREMAKDQIYELEKRIYLGKRLLEMLEAELQKPEQAGNKALIEKAMAKVTNRTRNMAQMVNILLQSIASIGIIEENNEKLEEAVFNAITMTQNVVTVSASIQLALSNQQKVMKAVKGVNEATEQMILSNAAALKSNTEEITKMLEQPSIAFETLQKAFSDLFSAIQTTEESNRRIIESGRAFIDKMDQFNAEIRVKLEGADKAGIPSRQEASAPVKPVEGDTLLD
ncbi:toxic anion resistance protein [Thermicanus aegyptius]|uniref:toxic anion resistance protein n=1 Tax=Thermicanus aegyptius TaxID=94009 RepID=UPI0003FA362F|nr:toxic anion resistance protein [Thermicanus aegyptius]